MSLKKKSLIPKIAKEDIIVYKVLQRGLYGSLYTILTNDSVFIGATYKGKFRKSIYTLSNKNPMNLITSLFSKYISSGYIHSLTHIPNDVEYAYGEVVAKCIIPKGTLYFIGERGALASRKLKYIELMK